MQKTKTLVKIKVYPSFENKTDVNSKEEYEGRFIGFIDNIMLRLLSTKPDAIRRISSIETVELSKFYNEEKSFKNNRLAFVLKSKNDNPVYNTLFITEKIERITHLNNIQTSISTPSAGLLDSKTSKTIIEKIKISCTGEKSTRFVLTEFYTC